MNKSIFDPILGVSPSSLCKFFERCKSMKCSYFHPLWAVGLKEEGNAWFK